MPPHRRAATAHREQGPTRTGADAHEHTADAFRNLAADHARDQQESRARAAEEARRQSDAQVAELLAATLSDAEWRALLAHGRRAAAQGGTQCRLMRFPAALCVDRGRAINLSDPHWPSSLRGKPLHLYARWRDELRPAGFRLTAQIVSFPDGLPGEAEITLVWA